MSSHKAESDRTPSGQISPSDGSSGSDSTSAPIIVWFRRDLRLSDNPALDAAIKIGRPLILVYIHEDTQEDTHETGNIRTFGGAKNVWLYHSLLSLSQDITQRGGTLTLLQGNALAQLEALIAQSGAAALYWNRRYSKAGRTIDADIKTALKARGLQVKSFNANLLTEPWEIVTKTGGFYKVFTPYWRAVRAQINPMAPLPAPDQLLCPPAHYEGSKALSLEDLQLLPRGKDWPQTIMQGWQPGEAGAQSRLHDFLQNSVQDYGEQRDFPANASGTSRLSTHLAHGEISPRQIWNAARQSGKNTDKFLSEIGWREFSYVLMYHFPDLDRKNFKANFDKFIWNDDKIALRRWQRGQTGYPFVDAGMRELWQTGWQHNRVRMVCASFLIKHLLIDWRLGEAWYWDCLLEADPASNAASWQWVAGCGADAAPYFRIFNPFGQGEKFDPEGDYVRRFVPELAKMPKKYIHRPWEAPANILDYAGVTLGKTYPKPIIEHKFARTRALEAYQATRV